MLWENFAWDRIIEEGQDNGPKAIQQTSDGGYIIAGGLYSGNIWTVYLLKTDDKGMKLWSKSYAPDTKSAIAVGVEQTPDGGYILAGQRVNAEYLWNRQIIVMETDVQGNIIWRGTYTDLFSEIYKFRKASDGGYIMAGYAFGSRNYFGARIVRMDSHGGVLWKKTYGQEGPTYAYDIQQTNDGGFIIVGTTSLGPRGVSYLYLVMINSIGDILWERSTFSLFLDSWARSVKLVNENEYIIAGSTKTLLRGTKVKVIRADSSGKILGTRVLGNGRNDGAVVVVESSDGGYVIAANSEIEKSSTKSYFIKIPDIIRQPPTRGP